jgi:hypothetical protein
MRENENIITVYATAIDPYFSNISLGINTSMTRIT